MLARTYNHKYKLRDGALACGRWSDPDIVVSLSTRPYFLSSSTYEGTDQTLRPRFDGITQVGQ